jgi:hypothetical protein
MDGDKLDDDQKRSLKTLPVLEAIQKELSEVKKAVEVLFVGRPFGLCSRQYFRFTRMSWRSNWPLNASKLKTLKKRVFKKPLLRPR